MIELKNVQKTYAGKRGRGTPLTALERVDLTIADGEFVTVVGPSGCGKTTMLNLLAGFEPASQGDILLDGQPVKEPGPERAVVFQQPSLLPWMTVAENIAFGLTLRNGPKHVNQERVAAMVETMGLKGFESHKPYELSGGMQQRVAIARALITDPRILLMDEPFGALDAQTRSDMQRFLLSLWKKLKPTVFFVTHDVEEAILLADRVLVMTPRPGRVAADMTIDLPRPRKWDLVLGREFNDYKRQILKVLRPEEREPVHLP
jgi:NitT/TauT family transport system ATP-binding protein